ncbi:MAG: DOMON-like domain-containing protein [Novosphingobium sp.]|nr:DOMON-like domain-containing protein [Novosphingobium sp.]
MHVQRTASLIPPPRTPAGSIHRIDVRWFETGDGMVGLRWLVHGAAMLRVPPFAGRGRGDELWLTTCCELFLRDREGTGYREFNFSPSGRWAAYRFTAYREGMAELDIPPPEVSSGSGQFIFVLTAMLDRTVIGDAGAAGLSAVIEEKDGTRSYWALAHPAGKPDFHDPACFALPLPARGGA